MAIINNLPTRGGVKMDLLWSNPNPNSNYSGGTVSVDVSSYDYLSIKYYAKAGQSLYSEIIMNVETAMLTNKACGGLSYEYNNTSYSRPFVVKSEGSIQFYQSYRLVNGTTGNTDNSTCIPIEIYGGKGKISY